MNKKIAYLFFSLFAAVILFRCAQVVAPTGGPKDEIPPKILESIPQNYSVNYSEGDIEILFDEYVKLDNINQKLLVSPPLKHDPITKLKGKKLVIELEDTLLENTTYTLNFADAIVDNNEGNPLKNFEFVFSTGSELDSLSVKGIVLDAFTHEPKEGILVMLYKNLSDSVPFYDLPYHVLKTGEDGLFKINNIKNDTFKIFAIEDGNANYLFDQPDEPIAFSDKYVTFYEDTIQIIDSIRVIDSIGIVDSLEIIDTIYKDSAIIQYKLITRADDYNLYLFQEDYKEQYLVESKREIHRRITFLFNRPLYYDSLKIESINFMPQTDWKLMEPNQTMDSISYWITDTSIIKLDTISVELSYLILDSLNELSWISDTVELNFEIKEEETKKKKKKKKNKGENISQSGGKQSVTNGRSPSKSISLTEEITFSDEKEETDTLKQLKIEYLKLALNVKKNSTFDLGKSIIITSPTPVFEYIPEKVKFFQIEDSLEFPREIKLVEDSIHIRRFILFNEWEENSRYKLLIEPEAFTDIYNLYNDTVLVSFKTKELEYYGTIILNLTGVNSNLLLQLLDNSGEKVLQQKQIITNQAVNISYLKPNEYKLRIIYDTNKNLKWDTGYYLEKIQPEKVLYYKEQVNVRSNWDIELTWNLLEEKEIKSHNTDSLKMF